MIWLELAQQQRRNTHEGTTKLMTIPGSRQTSCRFRTYEHALAFSTAIACLANRAGSVFFFFFCGKNSNCIKQETLLVNEKETSPRLCCTLVPRRGPFGCLCRSLPLCEPAFGRPVLMMVVVVGMVVSVDGFWLSGKGSSMLFIVQGCRGGLSSRHRAWGERGEGRRVGGASLSS